jgi:hypothetical protein
MEQSIEAAKIEALKEHFRSWSGGFKPESEDQITVYIDYAIVSDLETEEARDALLDWLENDDED